MASGKRQPSKQRRAAQNRAQRDALAARREAARQAEAAERRTGAQRGGGSWFSRLRNRPAATASEQGGWRATDAAGRAAQPVGYRAALTALLMAIAGVVFCFTFQVSVDADDEPFTTDSLVATWSSTALQAAADDPAASPEELAGAIDDWAPGRGSQPLAIALWPYSLSLLLPVIGAGVGFRAVAKRSRSRVVSRALFATLFGALLSQVPIFFLPSVVAMGVAVFQIRRYEMTVLAAEQAAAGDQPRGDVIEADVVEGEAVGDEAVGTDDDEATGTGADRGDDER